MTQSYDILVVGAGGHSKVVIATLREAGHRVAGVFDDNPALWGQSVLGGPVLGPLSKLPDRAPATAVLAVGDNDIRRNLARRLPGLKWITVVHPRAYVHASVKLGAGTVVCAGAVIQPDTLIGEHCIINTSASVDHDGLIGDFVHIAPGAHLAGGVAVGHGTLVGIGACVTPGVTIGADSIVGAGAVVIRSLPDGMTAVGVPARIRGPHHE
jgi:sugar O-acyltransferase (sialic acid O-acetyltransferase NeuD family)